MFHFLLFFLHLNDNTNDTKATNEYKCSESIQENTNATDYDVDYDVDVDKGI